MHVQEVFQVFMYHLVHSKLLLCVPKSNLCLSKVIWSDFMYVQEAFQVFMCHLAHISHILNFYFAFQNQVYASLKCLNIIIWGDLSKMDHGFINSEKKKKKILLLKKICRKKKVQFSNLLQPKLMQKVQFSIRSFNFIHYRLTKYSFQNLMKTLS